MNNSFTRFGLKCLPAAAALACAVVWAPPAQALDIDAGDYVPAPPGTDVGLVYLQHASRDRLYSKGQRVAGSNGLDSDLVMPRFVHFMQIGGLTVNPQVLFPFVRLQGTGGTSSLGSTSGLGDVIVAATIWVQNDPQTKQYTGFTPFFSLPTGKYNRNAALNVGENRWKTTLQLAHVRPMGDKFSLDLSGDVALFGDNRDYGPAGQTLKQSPMLQFQGLVRYHFDQSTDLRMNLSQAFGGETKIDGVSQDNRQSITKFNVGGAVWIGPKTQIVTLFGKDIKVREGFKESGRVNVRVLHLF